LRTRLPHTHTHRLAAHTHSHTLAAHMHPMLANTRLPHTRTLTHALRVTHTQTHSVGASPLCRLGWLKLARAHAHMSIHIHMHPG